MMVTEISGVDGVLNRTHPGPYGKSVTFFIVKENSAFTVAVQSLQNKQGYLGGQQFSARVTVIYCSPCRRQF